jgi:membrane fusion protein (multidrug efflux system)
MIPEEALVPVQRRVYVLAVDEDSRVQRKAVATGHREQGMVEITQGLSIGERIIVRGTTRVRPGQQVSFNGSKLSVPQEGGS